MSPQRIQRQRTKGWRMPEGSVYVGRPSRWGNPYALGRSAWVANRWTAWYVTDTAQAWSNLGDYGTEAEARRRAVELYAETVEQRIAPAHAIRAELAGKDLVCWCPPVDADGNPVPCHADVLLRIANEVTA